MFLLNTRKDVDKIAKIIYLQYRMFLLNTRKDVDKIAKIIYLQYRMFLLNGEVSGYNWKI